MLPWCSQIHVPLTSAVVAEKIGASGCVDAEVAERAVAVQLALAPAAGRCRGVASASSVSEAPPAVANPIKPRLALAADQRQHVTVEQAAVTRQLPRPRVAAVLRRGARQAGLLNLYRAVANAAGDLEALHRRELRLPAANVRPAVAGHERQRGDVVAADRAPRLRQMPLLLLDAHVASARAVADRRMRHGVPHTRDLGARGGEVRGDRCRSVGGASGRSND